MGTTEYHICVGSRPDKVEATVNERLAEGWSLHGELKVTQFDGGLNFCQAVTRTQKPPLDEEIIEVITEHGALQADEIAHILNTSWERVDRHCTKMLRDGRLGVVGGSISSPVYTVLIDYGDEDDDES